MMTFEKFSEEVFTLKPNMYIGFDTSFEDDYYDEDEERSGTYTWHGDRPGLSCIQPIVYRNTKYYYFYYEKGNSCTYIEPNNLPLLHSCMVEVYKVWKNKL